MTHNMHQMLGQELVNKLGWMLDRALDMPETRHAILLSADGLLMAHSQNISWDDADRQAAAMSGLQALARAGADFCGSSSWQQTVSEFDRGYVFLVAAGEGAYVAASTTEKADVEAVSFRLQDLVRRLGKELSSSRRSDIGGSV
ncbi:roadblock/LC7 domain-containing protein [Saccharopolyspora hattusasensis]|uniref:roadblock/LC7 domain-containing protein n=1 Tax=Saccharopolyspora hattusasensis TaxID=1128679 RepID=UPI003D99A003